MTYAGPLASCVFTAPCVLYTSNQVRFVFNVACLRSPRYSLDALCVGGTRVQGGRWFNANNVYRK